MQHEDRSHFYLIWHLIWGMLIAFTTAFVMLHGYSTRFEYLSAEEAVWRTITYVIPQWLIIIVPAGIIISMLSFAVHGFLCSIQGRDEETKNMGCYSIAGGFGAVFFIFVFQFYAIYILVPVMGECLILYAIDLAWDRQLEEKPKRKPDEA